MSSSSGYYAIYTNVRMHACEHSMMYDIYVHVRMYVVRWLHMRTAIVYGVHIHVQRSSMCKHIKIIARLLIIILYYY